MKFVVIKENRRLRTRDLLYHIKVLLCVIVVQCCFLQGLFVVNYTEISAYDFSIEMLSILLGRN